MKIKEVENRVGMTRANIRYYEKEGLLGTTTRNENNYREYTEEDVEQLQKIKILRLLGIAPADIKLLNADAVTMEALMQKRIKELEKAAKEIQDVHKICETIIDKQIDVHSLNESVLTGDRAVWVQRMEEILSKDIVNEVVSKKQVNATIAGMLAWGYLISAVVTVLLFVMGSDSRIVDALFDIGRVNSPFGELRPVNWMLWGSVVVTFATLISIYCTASVAAHVVLFHISAIVLSPLLLSILNRAPGANVSGAVFAVFWLMLIGYVALLYILSLKWDKMFAKMRYTLLVAAAYTVIGAVILAVTFEYWIIAVLMLLMFTTFIGIKWTTAVTDRETFNRYYAVRHAGIIMNLIGLVTWAVGYDNKQ